MRFLFKIKETILTAPTRSHSFSHRHGKRNTPAGTGTKIHTSLGPARLCLLFKHQTGIMVEQRVGPTLVLE